MADKYDVMTTAIQNSGVWMPILATTIGSAVTWWTARGSKKYAKQAVAETVVGNAKMEAVHGAVTDAAGAAADAAGAAVDASHNAVETALSARQAATESTEMIAQALQANFTAMNQHTQQIAALQKQVANLVAQFSPGDAKSGDVKP